VVKKWQSSGKEVVKARIMGVFQSGITFQSETDKLRIAYNAAMRGLPNSIVWLAAQYRACRIVAEYANTPNYPEKRVKNAVMDVWIAARDMGWNLEIPEVTETIDSLYGAANNAPLATEVCVALKDDLADAYQEFADTEFAALHGKWWIEFNNSLPGYFESDPRPPKKRLDNYKFIDCLTAYFEAAK